MELTTDPALQAAQRLELAVEKLASAIEKRLAAIDAQSTQREAGMVSRTEVAALSARFDAALSQLRAAVAEEPADPAGRN